MHRLFRARLLLPLAALGVGTMLGGCVAYPAYPAYGYGYAPYYGGSYVAVGGGYGGWHDHGDRHEGGGWHR